MNESGEIWFQWIPPDCLRLPFNVFGFDLCPWAVVTKMSMPPNGVEGFGAIRASWGYLM